MDAADENGAAPNQYSEPVSAQYVSAAYDANEYIAIDQTLDASTSYQTEDGKLLQGPLSNHVTLGNGNRRASAAHTNGDAITYSDVAEASQQNPHFVNPSKRKSPDDPTDATSLGGSSKRKRSKVSRACDQCRRKKIRCDADSEGSNQLKTCSNCQKATQICEYSRIPQKRGPSKGYIKELSERVQQVEGQLALQNSSGYRSSFDSQPGVFEAQYSPEDDIAFKSRSSFSQQRSPFADFTRDRIPSVGGWNDRSVTSNPRQQSVAIPPDQLGLAREKTSSVTSIKPFWSEWIESPQKKRSEVTDPIETTSLDKMVFEDYFQVVHPLCPILPDDWDQIVSVAILSSDEYRTSLFAVLKLLPQPSLDPNLNAHAPESRTILEKFINEKSRETETHRSEADSLVFIWTELMLLVVMHHDVQSWNRSTLQECDLLRMVLDQCDGYFKSKAHGHLQYDAAWIRTAYVTTMLARLYAISKGEVNDPTPTSVRRQLNINVRALPPRVTFLVQMTDSLQTSLSLLPDQNNRISPSDMHEWSRLNSSNLRAWLNAAGISRDDPLVAEVKAFGELLSLRCSISQGSAQLAIVGPVANLTEAIRLSAVVEKDTNNGKYLFNPLSLHTMTLATLTLLELLQCDFDDIVSGALVADATEDMKKVLSILVEKKAQLPGFTSGGKFWAEILMDMVSERLGVHASATASAGNSAAATTALETRGTEDDKIVDMTQLLLCGYMMPVTAFASRQNRA